MASAEGGHGPLHQFNIVDLIPFDLGFVDLSFTNSALWAFITVGVIWVVFALGSRRGRSPVPGRLQSMVEIFYEFIRDMVRDIVGEEGMKYFTYIFTLFLFIFFANILGMIPYSFTVTSHLAVTAFLALAVFVTVTFIGFWKHGTHFFSFFAPSGAPKVMLLLLVPIEVISYFVRPVSHSIRLGANMMAGHVALKVFASFCVSLGGFFFVPLLGMLGLTALEFLVAALQAYIFTILTCIYLNDALHMH